MIQLAMLFALGVLVACLVGLALLPLVTRRAERVVRARLERQMPLSMSQIAAERDQLRAAHAVEIRHLEQHAEGLNTRLASPLSETGRQSARLSTLEQQHKADLEAMADRDAAVERSAAALRDGEAALGAQAVVLHDAYVVADRRRELLDAATLRLSAAEMLIEDQRAVIADLERDIVGRALRPVAKSAQASRIVSDDMMHLRAAFARLRGDHDIICKEHEAMQAEREKLRFRVDELLLRIEDLQDNAETAGDATHADHLRVAQYEKTISTLTTRVAAREEALGTVKLLLADETARRKALETEHGRRQTDRPHPGPEPARYDDPAALRQAIAALAADLVRIAGTEAEPEARRSLVEAAPAALHG